jgi:hypothetical protein
MGCLERHGGRRPSSLSSDLHESCELGSNDDGSVVRLTCTITGSTYQRDWDGSEELALSLVDEAAEDTATSSVETPHYAWLRSGR